MWCTDRLVTIHTAGLPVHASALLGVFQPLLSSSQGRTHFYFFIFFQWQFTVQFYCKKCMLFKKETAVTVFIQWHRAIEMLMYYNNSNLFVLMFAASQGGGASGSAGVADDARDAQQDGAPLGAGPDGAVGGTLPHRPQQRSCPQLWAGAACLVFSFLAFCLSLILPLLFVSLILPLLSVSLSICLLFFVSNVHLSVLPNFSSAFYKCLWAVSTVPFFKSNWCLAVVVQDVSGIIQGVR